MAGRDRGAHAGRRSPRTHHVCSDRRDEGSKPTRRASVRSVTEGKAMAPAQTRSRSMKQEDVGVVALAPSEQLAGVAHHNQRALPISRSTDLANPLASRKPASSPGSSGYPD